MLLCSKSKNRPFFPSFPFKCHICPFSPAHFCHFVDGIPVSTSRQGSAPFQHIAFTQSGPKMHSAESLPFSPSSYFWLNHTFFFLSQLSYKCPNPVLPSTTTGWKISPHLQKEEGEEGKKRRKREEEGGREEGGGQIVAHMFLSTWKDCVLDCAGTTASPARRIGTYLEKEGMSAHP